MAPKKHSQRKPSGKADKSHLPLWRCESCKAEKRRAVAPPCYRTEQCGGRTMTAVVEPS